AQKLSPLTRTGSLEHRRAKDWSLRDPEGTVWNVRNLSEFVRSHPDLFLPEDVRPVGIACRAIVGLGQLRPGRRIKNPPGSWKGCCCGRGRGWGSLGFCRRGPSAGPPSRT